MFLRDEIDIVQCTFHAYCRAGRPRIEVLHRQLDLHLNIPIDPLLDRPREPDVGPHLKRPERQTGDGAGRVPPVFQAAVEPVLDGGALVVLGGLEDHHRVLHHLLSEGADEVLEGGDVGVLLEVGVRGAVGGARLRRPAVEDLLQGREDPPLRGRAQAGEVGPQQPDLLRQPGVVGGLRPEGPGEVHDDGALHRLAARPRLRLLLQRAVDPLLVLRHSEIGLLHVAGEVGGLFAEVGEGGEGGVEEGEPGADGGGAAAEGGAEGLAVDEDVDPAPAAVGREGVPGLVKVAGDAA